MDRWMLPVLYADIFDYPLTHRELHTWMIFDTPLPKTRKSFYTLKGREHLVTIRKQREPWQRRKWEIAQAVGRRLQRIPTIYLVGVTGGLSMNNARSRDDIDVFVVTAPGTLWITRLLSILLLWDVRRSPRDTNVKDKVCLNMFVDRSHLEVPEQDLFAAHEVFQMKPLWDRDNAYKAFIQANNWARVFLPNAQVHALGHRATGKTFIFRLCEPVARILQVWYMSGHRTREVITASVLRFHPKDARVWVKRKFMARLRRYHMPLDKNFFPR